MPTGYVVLGDTSRQCLTVLLEPVLIHTYTYSLRMVYVDRNMLEILTVI